MPIAPRKQPVKRAARRTTIRKLKTTPTVTNLKVTVPRVSTRLPTETFGDMPLKRVETYSGLLLRAIQRDLSGMEFFTREDLIQHPLFSHIATISRYGTVRTLVKYLIRRGAIVQKKRTDLFLKDHAATYVEEPLHQRYYNTVETVIRSKFGKRDSVTVMDVVAEWKTDNDLTINAKRTAVRGAVRRLMKENIISRVDEFTYRRK